MNITQQLCKAVNKIKFDDFPADVFIFEIEWNCVEIRRIRCADDIIGGNIRVGLNLSFSDNIRSAHAETERFPTTARLPVAALCPGYRFSYL